MNDTNIWHICFDHYDPTDEGRREVLLALGNGFLVTRAAAPETVDNDVHYPGTYRVGCYNPLTAHAEGKEIVTDSLVNLPHALSLTFRINGGPWFSLNAVEVLSYRQTLDMQQAVLRREIHFRDEQGRKTRLDERRLVSMAHPHLIASELRLTAENWSGELEVRSGIDGKVCNGNIPRYAPYDRHHLEILAIHVLGEESLELLARTQQSAIDMAVVARTRIHRSGQRIPATRIIEAQAEWIDDHRRLSLHEGEQAVIEKCAAYYTSGDPDVSDSRPAARQALAEAPDFDTLLAAHRRSWEQLWQRCSLAVDHPKHLFRFRLHMYHLLINLSPHTTKLDVGVPPSGWQGEEYLGQIFWDELFVFPFLSFRFPEIARSLLLYRYRRLLAARQLAQEYGYHGAMFPWRSARSGREETPLFQWNLLSKHWMPDYTNLQRHIGAIIAYNIWQYGQVTGDRQFLADHGAELFLEIARFWASIAQYNAALDRYEICGVVGPDEYHTQYPDANRPGINNNTYTNVMAVWVLAQARSVLDQLSPPRQRELQGALALSEAALDHWDDISRKMQIVFQEDGALSQFEGYAQLSEFDLAQFRQQHGNQQINWVLEAQGDIVERYQVAKQADTALLLYLFTPEELTALFQRLGYSVDQAVYQKTVNYQLARTAHESTLSRMVYAGALAHWGIKEGEKLFEEAQQVDLLPHQDEGTEEGIHLGAMSGTLALLQHHYLGLRVRADALEINPALPGAIKQVHLKICFRGVSLVCDVHQGYLTVQSEAHNPVGIKISCRGKVLDLEPGASVRFE